jgi:copper(I)-binding protein
MPPGSKMTAGFGQLINNSDAEIKIIGYSSPQFDSVTLHRSLLEAGLNRMEEVPALSLLAGSEIELAPGGYHLMFMRPTGQHPDEVLLHIDISGDRRFSFELPIERR